MPWETLYDEINSVDSVGNTLSTINSNFSAVDYFLENFDINYPFSQFLLKQNNLSDVSNTTTSRSNLGYGSDTMAVKDKKTAAQAFVVFNGNTVTLVNGEYLASIIQSYNVSKVIRKTVATNRYMFEVVYNNPLEYIGPVIADGGAYKSNTVTEFCDMYIPSSYLPTLNSCHVYPSRINPLTTTIMTTGIPSRYTNVVVF